MKFAPQFVKHERVFSSPGSSVRDIFGVVFDEKGRRTLEVKGQEDLSAYIQSFKDSVDIHVILKRFEQGDPDALMRAQAFYADVSQMPTTYAEYFQRISDGTKYFEELPVELKKEFNNSATEFFAALGSADADAIFRRFYGESTENPSVVSDVKEVKEGVEVNE